MNEKAPLVDQFYHIVESLIDEEGVYPHQMLTRDAKGELGLHALDAQPVQVYHYAFTKAAEGHEVVFGIDRYTRPGQGTTLGNALVCVHLLQGQLPRVGVIEYEPSPKHVLPWNWENSFWERMIKHEMAQLLADVLDARQEAKP